MTENSREGTPEQPPEANLMLRLDIFAKGDGLESKIRMWGAAHRAALDQMQCSLVAMKVLGNLAQRAYDGMQGLGIEGVLQAFTEAIAADVVSNLAREPQSQSNQEKN